MHKLILTALALLAGCASATQVQAPNGQPAYLVKCGNAVKSKCADKAAELCPGGYQVLNRNADPYTDTTKVGNIGALELHADTTTTLLVQCN